MIRALGSCLVVIALAAIETPATAQEPAERGELQALLVSLAGTSEPGGLTRASVAAPSAYGLLRRGLIELRIAELSPGRFASDQAEATLSEAAFQAPDDWPWPWYALARAKLVLAEGGFTPKASMHQALGESYRDAALRMLARSLDADSAFAPAVSLLAEVLLPLGERGLNDELQRAVRRAARNGAAPSLLLLGRLYRNLEQPDSALYAFRAYMRAGGDPGIGHLEEARALHALGERDQALSAYSRGSEHLRDAGRDAYRLDLAWIASPAELAAYDSLPADSVTAWIAAFWNNRDAAQLRAPGDRLVEHLRRWRYVHAAFGVTGRQDAGGFAASSTDCGRPSGLLGADNADAFSSALALYMPGILPATKSGHRYIDDRGIVYMRHGEPDARIAAGPAGFNRTLPPNESWKYNAPTGAMIFHFCGSRALGAQAPTTLVAMLPLLLEMVEPRGSLDQRFDRLAGDLQNQRIDQAWKRRGSVTSQSLNLVSATLVRALEESGEKSIRVGLATDSYRPRFRHEIEPLVQIYSVGDPDRGSARALVTFAVPGDQLEPTALESGGVGYPLAMRVIATNSHGDISRIDTTRYFRTADTLGRGEHLFGLAELPLGRGTWDVRIVLTQPGVDAGGAVGRLGVVAPGGASLALSDLVLGRERSGLSWTGPYGVVALNPLDAYPRNGTVELYYEATGLVAGARYRTALEIQGVSEAAKGRVELSFDERPTASTQAFRRTIGLEKLRGGQYRLTVTLVDTASGARAEQSRLINILQTGN